jgi:hypothetical protein
MAAPLNAILGVEGTATSSSLPQAAALSMQAAMAGAKAAPKTALADFLAREELGSPIEARELGRPVNGPAGSDPIPGAYAGNIEDAHAKIVKWFEAAERASLDEREEAELARRYVNGLQWTEEEIAALRKRGQPVITVNRIRDKISLLTGMERKQRSDPKAWPRTPAEEERADAATQALRFIADDCEFAQTRSMVFEEILVEGFAGAELGLEDDGKGGANVTITHVSCDRIWRDPHARAANFTDANHLGLVLWMDKEQLLDLYPDADETIGDAFSEHFGSYDDKPGVVQWRDNTRERVRVVQAYWKEHGEWWGATINRAGFLAEPQQSPFKDKKGRSACPLVLQSAYVDHENRRFGMVRDLISLQDEINKRRSKALHLLSVNRTIAEAGAVDDEDHARREAAKPDGWITVNPGLKLEMQPGGDLALGQFRLLEHATMEMQQKGPNASMSGTDDRDQSGRAILAQQTGGAVANEPLADALRMWSRRVMEIAWMACREYWTGQRWLRVTDDMGKLQFVGVNRPIRLMDELGAMDEQQRAMAMQRMQLQPNDPRLMQVIRVENDISDLEVDIDIEEGADVPALQAEQFSALMQLAGSQPGIIPPDVLIAASSLKDKAALLDRMKEAQQAQAQAAQAAAPVQQAMAQADIGVKQSQAHLNEARANDLQHASVQKVAQVHKMAAESYAIPDVGPVAHPQQLPTPPAQGMPQ